MQVAGVAQAYLSKGMGACVEPLLQLSQGLWTLIWMASIMPPSNQQGSQSSILALSIEMEWLDQD